MLIIDKDCSVAYAYDQAGGATFRYDVAGFRMLDIY